MKNLKYILFGVSVLFYLFYGLDSCGLFDDDEAYYSEVSREMAETGNYITPQFNYLPFLHKPVLFYWFESASYKLFGVSELSSRLPSAFFMLAALFAIYFFVSRLFNKPMAAMACVILLTNIEMMVVSKAATMDALLMLLISCSLFSYMTAYFHGDRRYYLWVFIFSALAVLTKGPSGIVIPALVIFCFLFFSGELNKFREMGFLKGALVFLAISLPWYLVVTIMTKGGFARDFFLYHNISRFSSSFEGHSGSIFYYFFVLLFGFYPWSAFLPSGIFRSVKKDKKLFFVLLWIVVPFVFFSIAQTKLPNYIVPAFVPVSIIVANWWNEYMQADEGCFRVDTNISLYILLFGALVMCVLLGLNEQLISMAKSKLDNPFLAQEISLGLSPVILSIILVLLIAGVFFCFKYSFRLWAFGVIAAGMFFFNFIMTSQLLPRAWFYVQGGLHELSLEVKNKCGEDSSLVVYALQQPSIVYYSQKKVKFLSPEEDAMLECVIANHQASGGKVFIITKRSMLGSVIPYGVSVCKDSGGYTLLSN
ncbi:MAG: hypothetical protein A2297_03275 [Elusimicrobia bacterium RIFOXYB2_FULL_48_7]|nr:MAG: hypothetical protein A2297_03275 [Elusimicrobia bacterium RIFOXYB2_FULL_48_7]